MEFTPDALSAIGFLPEGHPWLVNALAYESCFKIKAGITRENPITQDLVMEAKKELIKRQDANLDQLVDKLQEEQVRRVIEPILTGEGEPEAVPEDDIWYAEDLGLITTTSDHLRIANPIYQEIIPRILTYSTQLTIARESLWFTRTDGTLLMDKLIRSFLQFFRENCGIWIVRFSYKEAGPQFLLQVCNGW